MKRKKHTGFESPKQQLKSARHQVKEQPNSAKSWRNLALLTDDSDEFENALWEIGRLENRYQNRVNLLMGAILVISVIILGNLNPSYRASSLEIGIAITAGYLIPALIFVYPFLLSWQFMPNPLSVSQDIIKSDQNNVAIYLATRQLAEFKEQQENKILKEAIFLFIAWFVIYGVFRTQVMMEGEKGDVIIVMDCLLTGFFSPLYYVFRHVGSGLGRNISGTPNKQGHRSLKDELYNFDDLFPVSKKQPRSEAADSSISPDKEHQLENLKIQLEENPNNVKRWRTLALLTDDNREFESAILEIDYLASRKQVKILLAILISLLLPVLVVLDDLQPTLAESISSLGGATGIWSLLIAYIIYPYALSWKRNPTGLSVCQDVILKDKQASIMPMARYYLEIFQNQFYRWLMVEAGSLFFIWLLISILFFFPDEAADFFALLICLPFIPLVHLGRNIVTVYTFNGRPV